MKSFTHVIPALRLVQGSDCLDALARELDRMGSRRALIVCGRSLAAPGGGLERVRMALGPRCVDVFSGVQAHSPLPSVRDAADTLARTRADAVVAVGGGSATVTARAASIIFAEGLDVESICTRRAADGRWTSPRLLAPKLPQLLVPTTPTTACAKAGAAVFDPETHRRLALFDPKARAHAIFIDPVLVGGAPVALVQSAGLNALTMAVEGLESHAGDPWSDALLMHSLRLLSEYLPQLHQSPGDSDLRSQLMLAALLCGQGTDYTGGGIASVLGHAIGARFGVDNGVANAIVLPHTMRFNMPATASRIHKLVQALRTSGADIDRNPTDAALALIGALLARLSPPRRLRDVGVPHEAMIDIAEEAMQDWFVERNPRAVGDSHALVEVLMAAW